ncbi:MAG: SPFH domain-containing protein [bacterium]
MEITLTVAFITILIVIIIQLYFILTLYKKVPPNKALIVTGMGGKKVVVGGGTVVFPLLQISIELSLESRTIDIKTPQILTLDKVPLSIEATAIVKISSDTAQSILKAAERFIAKSNEEINKIIQEILTESLAKTVSQTTLDSILNKREDFIKQATQNINEKLEEVGITLENLSIKEIKDSSNTIKYTIDPMVINIESNNLTLDKKLVNIKSTLGIKFDLSNLKQAETFLNISEDKKISTLKEIFDSKIKAFISDHLQKVSYYFLNLFKNFF